MFQELFKTFMHKHFVKKSVFILLLCNFVNAVVYSTLFLTVTSHVNKLLLTV